MDSVIVRVKSHRARAKMQRALGYLPKGYYSWTFGGEFREVTAAELAKLQGIKGISRARVDRDQLRSYWDED